MPTTLCKLFLLDLRHDVGLEASGIPDGNYSHRLPVSGIPG